jgi:hypothetical protein
MDTRRLHNPDIKQLVQVLRTDPQSTVDPGDARFEKATQAAIKKLPRRLRSSTISWRGSLCRSHKELDVYLMNDVWSWIKYELGVAIGRFLYPIIMSDHLSKEDEYRVRQLEPVVRMFNTDWTLVGSAAPGKRPIDAGNRWEYQKNGCPACMLTRLGSDASALFALFACMYGHLRSRSGGQKGIKSVRSKRLRFVRYWIMTHRGGTQAAEAAYNLGVKLKTIRRDAKASLRHSTRPTHYTQDSVDEKPATPRHCLDDQTLAAFDISEPYHPDDRTSDFKHDPKIGPVPPLDPTTPTIIEGWDVTVTRADVQRARIGVQAPMPRGSIPPLPFTQPTSSQTPIPHRRDSIFSHTSTVRPRPASSIYSVQAPSAAMLRPPRPASYTYSLNNPNTSRLTMASSILSYNDPTQPSQPRGYDPLETSDEWLDKCIAPNNTMIRGYQFPEPSDDRQDDRRNTYMAKYRAPPPFDANASRREAVLLEGDFRNGVVRHEGRVLPKPSRCSIYSKFGEEGEDGEAFEIVDVTPPPSPVGEEFGEEMRSGDADADEGGSTPAPVPAPVPWYENPYGDCAPAPLRLQK